MIKDLILFDERKWNQPILTHAFSKELVDRVLSIPIHFGEIRDRLGWGPSSRLMLKVFDLF